MRNGTNNKTDSRDFVWRRFNVQIMPVRKMENFSGLSVCCQVVVCYLSSAFPHLKISVGITLNTLGKEANWVWVRKADL